MNYQKLRRAWTRANVWLDRRIGLHGGYYALQRDLEDMKADVQEMKEQLRELQEEDE